MRGLQMKCKKCIKGVIMKQISIGEFTPIECDCYIEDWFKGIKK